MGCRSGKNHSPCLLLFRQTGTGEFLVHPECLGICRHVLVRSEVDTNKRACFAKTALADTLRRCERIRNTRCARVCTHFATPPGCEEREETVRKIDSERFHDAGAHVAARVPGRKSCTLQDLNVANLGAVDQVSDIPRHSIAAQGCCKTLRKSATAHAAHQRHSSPRAAASTLRTSARACASPRTHTLLPELLPAGVQGLGSSARAEAQRHKGTVYLPASADPRKTRAGEGKRRQTDARRGEREDARTHGKKRALHAMLCATRVRWMDAGKLTSHAGAKDHNQHHSQACAAGLAQQCRCPPVPQAAAPQRGHGCRRHCVEGHPVPASESFTLNLLSDFHEPRQSHFTT